MRGGESKGLRSEPAAKSAGKSGSEVEATFRGVRVQERGRLRLADPPEPREALGKGKSQCLPKIPRRLAGCVRRSRAGTWTHLNWTCGGCMGRSICGACCAN